MTVLSRQLNIPEKPELESQEQHWGVLTEAVGCISAKKTLVISLLKRIHSIHGHIWQLATCIWPTFAVEKCVSTLFQKILPAGKMGCCRIHFGHPKLPVEMVMAYQYLGQY